VKDEEVPERGAPKGDIPSIFTRVAGEFQYCYGRKGWRQGSMPSSFGGNVVGISLIS